MARSLLMGMVLMLACARNLRGEGGAAPGAPTDDDLRIRGVFNSVLPGTEKKNSLRLVFHPHLGDLLEKDHLRVPLGLRYGLTSRLEVSGALEGYVAHGLGSVGFFSESGLDSMRLGTKLRLGDALIRDWDLSVGVDWERPLGSPPVDITDGLQHVSPFISFSHRLSELPRTRVFGTVAYDDVTSMRIPGHLEKNELGDDALEFSAGILHERGPLTYTFEAMVATTRFTGRRDEDSFTLRPGLIWTVPERFTFGGRGKWLLGASLRGGYGPDGFDVGAGVKLRINFDLKRLLGRHHESSGP